MPQQPFDNLPCRLGQPEDPAPGRPGGADASSHAGDPAESKRAEDLLLETQDRYRVFPRPSAEGVSRWVVPPPTPTRLPEEEQIALIFERAWLAECNDAMARMFGFERAEELAGARLR